LFQFDAKQTGNPRGGGKVGRCVVFWGIAESHSKAVEYLTRVNPYLKQMRANQSISRAELGYSDSPEDQRKIYSVLKLE
jgi:hypothetical protein